MIVEEFVHIVFDVTNLQLQDVSKNSAGVRKIVLAPVGCCIGLMKPTM